MLKAIEYFNNNHEIIKLYSSQNINQNEALGQKIYNQIYNILHYSDVSINIVKHNTTPNTYSILR